MKLYSASEAIWPALERTWSYLFRAFKFETFLKLATVATISEGFVVSIRFWVAGAFPWEIDWARIQAFLLQREFLPVTILGAIALFLVGVYVVLLVTRLRFGFVHCLIHQTRDLRSSAKLYADESERFFSATILVWLSFLVLCVAAFVLFVLAGVAVYQSPTPEGKLDPGHFLVLFFPCMGIAFALVAALCLAQIVLNDFILPHMAIEGLSFRKAWAEVRIRIRANRETFLSYLILRLGMPIVAGVILVFLAWVTGWIVFAILGMSAAGFNAMLDGYTGMRDWLRIGLEVLLLVLGLVAGCIIAAVFGGPLSVFMRSYALFYYGGHYKALGNLLEPHTPLSVAVHQHDRQPGS